jgi:hypothetical protein
MYDWKITGILMNCQVALNLCLSLLHKHIHTYAPHMHTNTKYIYIKFVPLIEVSNLYLKIWKTV